MILGNKLAQAVPAPFRRAMRPFLRPVFRKLEKRRLRRLYAGLAGPGDLVFDVGAHTGDMAKILLDLGTKVVCVDPQPACVEALRARFAGRSDLAIEAVGLGSEPGDLEFTISRDGPQASTFSEKWKQGRFAHLDWGEKIRVPVTTLDALIQKHGAPRFCKIDVEGFETQVLSGLNRPLPFVSFEFTREYLDDAVACMEKLESLAPTAYQVSLYNFYRPALPEWSPREKLLAFLRGNPSPDLCGDIYAKTL